MLRLKTAQVYQELCQVLPGGVNSPVRACKNVETLPLLVEYGYGEKIVDIEGNHYIDYCGSWGALLHGHAHPLILQALHSRMQKGTSFGIATELEGQLAKEIIGLMPAIEKIRFVSSGTEATMSAIRLARGFTKKKYIIKFSGNYHGHADSFLVQAGSGLLDYTTVAGSAGLLDEISHYTLCLPYNDLAAVEQIFTHSRYQNQIAAVIIEPIAGNMGVVPAKPEFLHLLRKETEKRESLLIFDEVITGFRVAKGGAQSLYALKPDLTCLGKIIGGGLPAAAFGGKKEIMDLLAPLGDVYQAGTLAGNPLAMEAGLQTLHLLQQPHFYENLQIKTDQFLQPIRQLIQKHDWPICIQQVGSLYTLFFGRKKVENKQDALATDSLLFKKFFSHLLAHGIYVSPSPYEACFISTAHTEESLHYTKEVIIDFLLSSLSR